MLITTIVAGAVIGAVTGITYIRYVSARFPGRPIPLLAPRRVFLPLWVDLTFTMGWLASSFALLFTLPLWLGSLVYCGTALLPFDLMRRHHNRQCKNRPPTSADGSLDPTESTSLEEQ